MKIKKTNDSCTLTFNADEFRIFKDRCKQTILSSLCFEDSIKNAPDDLKNDESFNSMIKHLKEALAFSKEFEEKYCYEGNDLGANYSKDETIFKVWAPTAEDVVSSLL